MGRRIIHACKEAQTGSAVQTFLKTVPAAIPKNGAEQPVETQLVADDYKMKVIKYIPTEIIAAYVTLEGIINASNQAPAGAYWMVFVILLVLTPLYVWRITNQAHQKPAWDQIIVSFFSFIIWVMALGGPFATLSWYQPIYPALLLPIFTLIVPLFNVKK
ncbi:MAG: hypothetical protein GX115_18145 [Ruminiclostridium sp.]|nr:hypothetical protein [Ruminiclostridium sp.]